MDEARGEGNLLGLRLDLQGEHVEACWVGSLVLAGHRSVSVTSITRSCTVHNARKYTFTQFFHRAGKMWGPAGLSLVRRFCAAAPG